MHGAIVEVMSTKFPAKVKPNGAIAFLDRDGVINIGSPNYINNPDEVKLLDGAAEAIGDLKRQGFLICIVTNQSAIARQLWGPNRLSQIHERLQSMIIEIDNDATIDLIVTCPHRQIDRCKCRKPMPGMLYLGESCLRDGLKLNKGLNTNIEIPDQVVNVNWWREKPPATNPLDLIIGDRKSDLGAGWARGVRLFKVNQHIGINQVIHRVINTNDEGDDFQPVR